MPETPNYGFEYETPQSKPGITLTGDVDGSAPILAEQVDAVITGIDTRLTAAEGAVASLQEIAPSDTGWQNVAVSMGAGFSLNSVQGRQWGPVFSLTVDATRTGSDIVANSAGNVVGDPPICTITPTLARPDRLQRVLVQCTVTSGGGSITTAGVVQLTDLHSNSVLRTDDGVRVTATYFVSSFN